MVVQRCVSQIGRKSSCCFKRCYRSGRAIVLMRVRESDRSNDFAATSDRNGEKSHEERPTKKRERKRGEGRKKVEAYRITLARPIALGKKKARSPFSVCLSACVENQKNEKKGVILFLRADEQATLDISPWATAIFLQFESENIDRGSKVVLFFEKVIRLISRDHLYKSNLWC